MDLYRSLIRPVLFRFDPEWIHVRTLLAARAVFDRMRGSVTGPHTRENADETMRFWYSRA